MQNGDFPGMGAKSLDERRILHYKWSVKINMEPKGLFRFSGIFFRFFIFTTTFVLLLRSG